MTHPDETLDYWAGRFIAAGLADTLSFDQFMELSPALRERRIEQQRIAREAQQRIGSDPPDAALHGDRLIDPMQHGMREYRQPLFYRRRNHV